ncbi:MAG: hypothetical protein ACOCVJ_01905, partial [Verrucomicrobiota bacterium]
MDKAPPTFDRSFLIGLAGGMVYQQAEKLFEAHAVLAAEWRSPVLTGTVKGAQGTYQPRLNLRSTVFAENICNCPVGRKHKICAHAVAAALHFQAVRREAKHAAEEGTLASDGDAEGGAEATGAQVSEVRSVRLTDDGVKLRLLVFLPPNLEAAAGRNAIVVKLDAAAGREILPLNKLSSSQPYAASEAQRQAMLLIESWCGGKLAGLLQLTKARLRRLLEALRGEPVVYWVKNPHEPIPWEGGRLAGVHERLELSAAEKAAAAREDEAIAVVPESKPRIRSGMSVREQSKPNPRRAAEAGAYDGWKTRSGDFPTADSRASDLSGYPPGRIIVDGSQNFLAIRLPSGDADDPGIRQLRSLLKAEGFMLEPSNRKWWLRDRHKTLNFLAAHWRPLKEGWRAIFTESFEKKLKDIELSKLSVEAREADGRFKLEVSLSDRQDEMDLRRALASGKHYLGEEEGGRITLLDKSSVDRLHAIEKAVSGQVDRPFTPTFSKTLNTSELVDVEDLIDEVCEGWQPPEAWQSRSRALKQVGALEPAPVRPGYDAV